MKEKEKQAGDLGANCQSLRSDAMHFRAAPCVRACVRMLAYLLIIGVAGEAPAASRARRQSSLPA